MELKRKEAAGQASTGGPAAPPLLEEPARWRARVEGEATADGKKAVVAEIASAKDASAIPLLAEIAAECSDEEVSEAAREAVLSFGMDAVAPLRALESGLEPDHVRIGARELADEAVYSHYHERANRGDLSAVGEIVGLHAELSTGSELAEYLSLIVTEDLSLAAVPELVRIADTAADPCIQDCAIVMLCDIAAAKCGSRELLEAVPMLGRRIRALEDVEVERGVIERIRKGGPDEAAAVSLLVLRTIHPALSVVSNSLDLLRELWEQNPGNEAVEETAYTVWEKIGTKDPILNDLLRKTIREICGIEPPLKNTDKIEN